MAGSKKMIAQEDFPEVFRVTDIEENPHQEEFSWGDFLILPLRKSSVALDQDEVPPLLGILGIAQNPEQEIGDDQREALFLLADRAALALEDRQLQQTVFASLQDLEPQAKLLQRWRASGRYDSKTSMLSESLPPEADLANWVKDALSHYWGGPKLSGSPLMNLEIVRQTVSEHDGNAVNALREILRKGVEGTRPEGKRRFTAEWILYNILEMKFIEGYKVREVASRLAMSEADLYRKQRIAVESVARTVLKLETEAQKKEE
jgi:hypothetical protein